jgi:hypothetical protein
VKQIAVGVAVWLLSASAGPSPAPARTPVLVELFTSEGCSSCPPADALLSKLLSAQPIDTVEVVPLEFHVDYWDRLGWKDPFASAAYSKRQQDYSRHFGPDKVYTPQVVVDGQAELVGSDEAKVVDAIRSAAAKKHLPLAVSASARGSVVRVSVEAPAAAAGLEPTAIVVALVEDGVSSAVRRGENTGRTLAHSAVVRRHQIVGTLQPEAFVAEGEWPLNPAWQRAAVRIVTFLQGEKSGQIYGAASASLK